MNDTIRSAAKPLSVTSGGVTIPTVYWVPPQGCKGIVVACHGGSGHKLSAGNMAIAAECLSLGLAVLAIDGPDHGDRRADGSLDPQLGVRSFREGWAAATDRTTVAIEMSAALDALMLVSGFAGLPVGYTGVSMGTAYGIPFLANDKRISAAAIGLWSIRFPGSEHMNECAPRITCPVWFTQQWDDQFLDREGTLGLFDAIGSADKRLVAYPGPHRELEGERLRDAMVFLHGRLTHPS